MNKGNPQKKKYSKIILLSIGVVLLVIIQRDGHGGKERQEKISVINRKPR